MPLAILGGETEPHVCPWWAVFQKMLDRRSVSDDYCRTCTKAILNVGGFSDAVFSFVAAFLANDGSRFVAEVEAVEVQRKRPQFRVRAGGVCTRQRLQQGGIDRTICRFGCLRVRL